MALNIKNAAVEQLAAEVATMAGESKTQAIGRALAERKARLELAEPAAESRAAALEFLEREVWSQVPARDRGKRLTRAQEDKILGYGRDGV